MRHGWEWRLLVLVTLALMLTVPGAFVIDMLPLPYEGKRTVAWLVGLGLGLVVTGAWLKWEG